MVKSPANPLFFCFHSANGDRQKSNLSEIWQNSKTPSKAREACWKSIRVIWSLRGAKISLSSIFLL